MINGIAEIKEIKDNFSSSNEWYFEWKWKNAKVFRQGYYWVKEWKGNLKTWSGGHTYGSGKVQKNYHSDGRAGYWHESAH